MKRNNQVITGIISAASFFVLIIDSKTAIGAARNGITLCIQTVLPSLFPFFIISNILTSSLNSGSLAILRPVARLTGVPEGGEPILLVGLLGGYPVGAQSIAALHKNKQISTQDARRLLGFCNNAGPSFIFGILGSCFSKSEHLWALWLIHIVSALLVGMLLPKTRSVQIISQPQRTAQLTDALKNATQTSAIVCGWVVTFRIIIAFLQKWVLWIFPPLGETAIIGATELVNGCLRLQSIGCEGLRFCLCSVFLAFGGLCVAMQTASVTKSMGIGSYFQGKAMQMLLSFIISYLYQFFRFEGANRYDQQPFTSLLLLLIVLFSVNLFSHFKKTVAFHAEVVYNK